MRLDGNYSMFLQENSKFLQENSIFVYERYMKFVNAIVKKETNFVI